MQGISRVRVTPQLIRTSDDTQVWAEPYDRVLDQIFEVQSEIAEEVVKQLDIKLMEPERKALRNKPTKNMQAYDYYLLGFQHNDRAWEASDAREFEKAIEVFQKAIDLDPNFVHAHLMQTNLHSWVYFTGFDRSEERLALAKAAIDRARQLQPDLPDIQRALAYYYYRCFRDYDRALLAFQRFRKAVPSSSPYLIASIQRRQGKWQESVAAMEESVALDPRNSGRAFNLGATYMTLRDYQKAGYWYDRALSLTPGYADPTLYKYRSHLLWKGNARDLQASLHAINRSVEVNFSLHQLNLMEGRFQEALAHVDSLSEFIWRGATLYLPSDLAYAQIYALMGEITKSKEYAEGVGASLKQKVQERPTDPRVRVALGLDYAFLGRKEDAIREGEKAVELFPISKDALNGPRYIVDLAWIYATVGEKELATEQLELLLSIPSRMSVALLRIDPRWDSLREHPRFQKLLARGTN